MFIIPTGLLKENSMISTVPDKIVEKLSEVDVETIEKILSLEKKFNDFIFEPSTWFDGFIVELLRWFDNKINEISDNDNEFDQWKTYYEQIVRILYHFVVYEDLNEFYSLVKMVFEYLFSVDDPYRNDYNIISSEKLMDVYTNIIDSVSCDLHYHPDDWKNPLRELLIGIWDTKEMEDKVDDIVINVSTDWYKCVYDYKVTINDECIKAVFIDDYDYDNYESDSDSYYSDSDSDS